MKTQQRIYAALVLLLVLGAAFYMRQQSEKKEASEHSATAASSDLPTLAIAKEDLEKLDKLEIKNADKSSVTLVKKGDAWEVDAPVKAKANAANVRSLLDNLKELKAKEVIDTTAATYEQYELVDAKAVHIVAYKGAEKALDMYFGKSGSRGQMGRTATKDGVYVVGGYSSYLYTREVKNWRETGILKFEEENVVQLEVENKNGAFSFSKNGDKWSASFTKREKGKLAKSPEKKWDKFDEAKVKDMLRAYKGLAAEDFAEASADTGLAAAESEGGVVRVKLKDNAGDFTVRVGKTAKGSSRYAEKVGGDGTIYVLSQWAADWAVAEATKFEKGDDKKAPPPDEGEMPDLEGMMQGMPGMQ
jgi:hypothetical protein